MDNKNENGLVINQPNQLQSMRTYKECLSARISDILCEDINETK